MYCRTNIQNLIAQLAEKELRFMRSRFLAPVAGGGEVQVRIGGAICRLRIRPKRFAGWGVFMPLSYTEAELERPATLTERAEYLSLFPAVQFVLAGKENDLLWIAQPAQLEDARFKFTGPVRVNGVDDAQLFDTIIARFDGCRFWFEQIESLSDPAVTEYLRVSITMMRDPRKLDRPGISASQRLAYTINYTERLRRQILERRATGEGHVREALAHAGATLLDLNEVADSFRVTFTVDGHRHTSVINKNLSVYSAGVCLSGQDQRFDLTSLVSVLRAGHSQGGLYHGLQV